MAEEFKLSPEEAVILRIGKIGYGGGLQLPSMFNSNELILTNKNLILLKKNMFGQTEDTLYFPLSKILMANGRPQVKKSNPSHMEYALDVYFETGMSILKPAWRASASNGKAISTSGWRISSRSSPEYLFRKSPT